MVTSDVPTTETLEFVRAHLPFAAARILEVGCGDGALAARLQAAGHQVVALDASTQAVARARQHGVDARVANWPDFVDAPFDAVLFTRSLHHIKPLPRAISRAMELLNPRGKTLVEDFAFSEVTPLAVEWLYGILATLDAAGVLRRDVEGFANELLRSGGSLEAWKAAHDHDLHSAREMLVCLQEHLDQIEMVEVPYFYRYVCTLLEESETGYGLALRVLELEKRFAGAAQVPLIGRRFVGTRA